MSQQTKDEKPVMTVKDLIESNGIHFKDVSLPNPKTNKVVSGLGSVFGFIGDMFNAVLELTASDHVLEQERLAKIPKYTWEWWNEVYDESWKIKYLRGKVERDRDGMVSALEVISDIPATTRVETTSNDNGITSYQEEVSYLPAYRMYRLVYIRNGKPICKCCGSEFNEDTGYCTGCEDVILHPGPANGYKLIQVRLSKPRFD